MSMIPTSDQMSKYTKKKNLKEPLRKEIKFQASGTIFSE